MSSLQSKTSIPANSISSATAAATATAAAVGGTDEIDWAEDDAGQLDGATQPMHGSAMVEPGFEVQVKLIDSNSPLYSIKSFEELGLSEAIIKGIYDMRFLRPSKIQEKALPLLLVNPPMNMIGQSQSGTGKTAAFVLNCLSRVDLSTPQLQDSPQAIILAPTRELARQILGVVEVMGKFIDNLKACASIPVVESQRGQQLLGSIIVGTPGTTMDLIKRRQLRVDQLKVLVLDEADNMLDQQGMGEQCMRVKMQLPKNLQIVLFSATFPTKVVEYAKKFAPMANEITLKHEELTVEGIKQLYLDCTTEKDKYDVLVKLYGLMTIGSSIIFVKRRITADEINQRMTAEGHQVAHLSGALEGRERDVIIDQFRTGEAKVLITTNVLARGIDVQTVSMVINYDVPDDNNGGADYQTYLHRIGRTGRFGRTGVSISFVYDISSWQMLMSIAEHFKVEMVKLETDDWDALEDKLKKILKASSTNANFRPSHVNAIGSSQNM